MELTQEEKAVLAHVVINPDLWVENAIKSTAGESAVMAKIERWRPEYLAQKDLPGYLNRVERDAAVAYKTPEQLAAEQAEVDRREAKAQAFVDNLPSWATIETTVDNIGSLTDAKAFLLKLARIVYWLAKDRED